MADVRALLAAERQSRRIAHPHLSYTKSGILLCIVCNLNVKSETLWEGHLRSANHRKNALASQETTAKQLKRKHEDDEVPREDRYEADRDGRKKPKSRSVTLTGTTEEEPAELAGRSLPTEPHSQPPSPPSVPTASSEPDLPPQSQAPQPDGTRPQLQVDEDEWAAFEREVAPLTEATKSAQPPTYEGATIIAAPVTAAQIAQQADEEKRRRLDTEADDEKEDEGRRLEDEFDVMEEMEERVRKLREKREALRHIAFVKDRPDKDQQPASAADGGPEAALLHGYHASANSLPNENYDHDNNPDGDDDDDDHDEDDEDDWYR
ncbi:uncharacterized protein A1O9_04190 [Exophiala aquamarina CBS 119918]|uniref:Uncharacterized protein n=1 Tax=Exophiala aquamarina CBS 119918 TaxID=1182545 RepID=A0A072PHL8_9EURO|nr:uncharacterized protein A1O9_04190 [Exophiala aquamarina CBS 119918]KEF59346.1 hypothetical protein A1O9_04190 [Exophiala aquamarina CBS 119918]